MHKKGNQKRNKYCQYTTLLKKEKNLCKNEESNKKYICMYE